MKRLCILAFVSAIISTSFAQIMTVKQGHDLDDIYVDAYRNYYPNRALYHITGYGTQINTQYEYPQNTEFTYFFADPTPGVLIGKLATDPGFSISYDYGRRWVPIANLWDKPGDICGGGTAGECYFIFFLGQDTMNPCYAYSMAYSTDFGNTTQTLFDTGLYHLSEAGHQPGELYYVQMAMFPYEFELFRSTDYGIHYDSTFFSVEPGSSTNFYQYIAGLHRGARPGELFLVVADMDMGSDLIYYYIHHTNDYGQTWTLQQSITKSILDGDCRFTSGRDSCSFYWVEHWNGDDFTPSRTIVHYSSDCGQTFDSHEYQLAVPAALPESALKPGTISITPNPAKGQANISCTSPEDCRSSVIRVISCSGQVVRQMIWNGEERSLDLSGLSPGIYLVQVKGPGIDTFTKLMIE